MAKNTKKATQEKAESAQVNVSGIITTAMYGKRKFANGKQDKVDKYRLSIKVKGSQIDKVKEAAEPFFEDTDDQWIPDLLKEDTPEEGYINLASSFDIRIGQYINGQIADRGSMTDFIADNGGNINGSKAVVSITVKEGALYPAAIIIKELKKQDISSLFPKSEAEFNALMNDDDLPFK